MFFGEGLSHWIAYFILYSFFGWLVEVFHERIQSRRWINRGFLKGPFCPIYGFGVLLLLGLLAPFQNSWIRLFFGGVAVITVLEFVTGFLLERLFGARWWDYHDEKFHIKGYVCPKYSLLFGLLALAGLKGIHPGVETFVEEMPVLYLQAFGLIILTYITVDFVQAVLEIIGLNRLLKELQQKLEEIKQLEIRQRLLKERKEKLGKMEKQVEEVEQRLHTVMERFKELKIEYEIILRAGLGRYRRILKAFPRFQSKRFQQGYKKLKERFKSLRQ